MKRFLVPAFLVTLLAACAPAPAGRGVPDAKKPATGTVRVAWIFEQTDDGDGGEPRTQVSLRLSGDLNDVIAVGAFAGSCAQQRPDAIGAEDNGILLAARCWWAGGGDDVRVRRTTDALRIEHRTVDEGTAEEPAPVLPFGPIGDERAVDASLTVR